MTKLKVNLEQLKNYIGTNLKFEVQHEMIDEYYYINEGNEELFDKGAIWTLAGYTDVSIPAGEGDIDGIILSHEKGFFKGWFTEKPLFYNLKDLDKQIPELGFIPLRELFQIAYESVYDHRFDGKFDDDPNWGKNLGVISKEECESQEYRYGFTVELPNQFLFSVNGKYLTVPNFTIYQKLFEWNFWVYSDEYFNQGLILDKLKHEIEKK